MHSARFVPPEAVRGMTVLDRSLFCVDVIVPTLQVNAKSISRLLKLLKNRMIDIRGIQPVQPSMNEDNRLLLLDPRKYGTTEEAKKMLQDDLNIQQLNIDKFAFGTCNVTLSYANWSAEEILKSIFPKEVDSVTGFSVVGHIAHLNLKECHNPYKFVIGQVLLDKHKNLETVVNKLDNIDNTYRNFAMEVLAGKQKTTVTVKENGCSYEFNFAKVYWNSRLGTEHERLVKMFPINAVLYDVFAGVGPFAVPAARKGCTVWANDLNPESYKSLCSNMLKNKVKGDYRTFNLDGRVFIRDMIMSNVITRLKDGDQSPTHIVMNLPALALEFLDAFIDSVQVIDAASLQGKILPTVHCYCFSKETEGYHEDVAKRINSILSVDFVTKDMVRRVRNVAPNKEMLCATFSLSWEIISSGTGAKPAKRPRVIS